MSCFRFIASLAAVLTIAHAADDVVLNVGTVKGQDVTSPDSGRAYSAYYGVPYALPPTGNRRFAPTEPYVGTGPSTVISSDTFRAPCAQASFNPFFVSSEDCLHLNIFVPAGAQQSPQPKKVMVWVPGGGFIGGSAKRYVPGRLVTERDVIVVTLQYRVAALGLASQGEGLGGNWALQDAVMALRWVRANIASFGGDADDVTLFGKSAGASVVNALSLSPMAKGLFTKAIAISGVVTEDFLIQRRPADQWDALVDKLGCTPRFAFLSWLRSALRPSTLACMRGKTAAEIQQAAQRLAFGGGGGGGGFGNFKPTFYAATPPESQWRVTVDGDVFPRLPSILIRDENYLRANGVLDRKYIYGFNNNEGLLLGEIFFSQGGQASDLEDADDAQRVIANVLDARYPYGYTEAQRAVAEYEYSYPRDSRGNIDKQQMLDLVGGHVFGLPILSQAQTMAKYTDVFVYLLDFFPRQNAAGLASGISGSSHALDLAYLWDEAPQVEDLKRYDYYTQVPDPQGSDASIFIQLQGSFTQFAKTGAPGGYSGDVTGWPRYDDVTRQYLAVSTSPAVRSNLYAKRLALWTQLFN